MEDDGIPLLQRILYILLVVGAIILIFLFTPENVVSYTKAETPAVEIELLKADPATQRQALKTEQESTAQKAEEIEDRSVIVEDLEKPNTQIPVYDPESERILHAIALCESQDTHFGPDGSVLMNRHGSSAMGRFQLMASIWKPVAASMGIDIATESGNKQMAYYILTEGQGIGAWAASATCLAKHNVFIQ